MQLASMTSPKVPRPLSRPLVLFVGGAHIPSVLRTVVCGIGRGVVSGADRTKVGDRVSSKFCRPYCQYDGSRPGRAGRGPGVGSVAKRVEGPGSRPEVGGRGSTPKMCTFSVRIWTVAAPSPKNFFFGRDPGAPPGRPRLQAARSQICPAVQIWTNFHTARKFHRSPQNPHADSSGIVLIN